MICNTHIDDIKCSNCNIFDLYNYHTLYSIDYHLDKFELIKFYCYNNTNHNNICINYYDKKMAHQVNYLDKVDFPNSIESLNLLYNRIQKLLIFK